MQALLAKFNEADRQLSRLTQAIPNLSDSLNHHLFIVFPDLTPGSSVDTLYINHEEPPLPGQQPRLIRWTSLCAIHLVAHLHSKVNIH